MSATAEATAIRTEDAPIQSWMVLLLAAACGLIAANLYYAQPLIGPISGTLGLAPKAAGLIVTMTQVGYGCGLLLIVPLGDLFEARRLIVLLLGLTVLALLGAALAPSAVAFLVAAFGIGLFSVAIQVLVPLASLLAPEAMRGRVVGNVMSGLMCGIMLARPVASLIAAHWPWQLVFAISAVLMAGLAAVLARLLPSRRPDSPLGYGGLLASMVRLMLTMRLLQRRALYQACLFGAFSLFWTTVPLLLAGPAFHMGQTGIALFALAGAAGAVAAPIAGRLADRGLARPATLFAMLIVAASLLASQFGQSGSTASLVLLAVAAIVLDFGVTTNLVVGQRLLYSLGAAWRSRINGLYMASFFAGAAVSSAVGAWAYAQGGWRLSAGIGLLLPVTALLCAMTEGRGRG